MPDGQCESPSIGQAMPEGSLSLCRGRPFRGGDDGGEKNCNGIFFLLDEEKSRKFGLSAISVSGREKYIIEDLHRCVCVCVCVCVCGQVISAQSSCTFNTDADVF